MTEPTTPETPEVETPAVEEEAVAKHAAVETAPADELLVPDAPHSAQNPITRAIVGYLDDAAEHVKALFIKVETAVEDEVAKVEAAAKRGRKAAE
jgi:hypothetical protein